MLIAIIVYLSIGTFLTFGLAKKELFELVKEDSLAMKIINFVFWTIAAPVIFVYGFIKEMSH